MTNEPTTHTQAEHQAAAAAEPTATQAPDQLPPPQRLGVEAHLPDDVRAYFWGLERQLGRRQRQLARLVESDDYQNNPVSPACADDVRTLRREIELLNAAWAHPPGLIKDWENLPPALPGILKAAPDSAPRPVRPGEGHRLGVLQTIRDMGLDPQAIKRPAPGKSGDKAAVRAQYVQGHRGRGQAPAAAVKAFDNAWQQLRDDGRIKDQQPS